MGYRFPQIPHKVYSKTFLKDVHLIFKYALVHPDDATFAAAKCFFENKFNGIKIGNTDIADGVNIKSTDELIWFDFKWDRLVICMKSPMYKSFDLTLEVMKYALEFFETVGVTDVEKVVFYKFNELSYNLAKDVPVSEVMKQIFSEELLKNMTKEDVDVQMSLSRWEKLVNFNDKDSVFTIEFGFGRSAKDSNTGSLTLKTQIESNLSKLPLSKIENTLREYNQILDNAFHWCILPRIVKEME
jgi:hypothetical protein